MARAAHRHSSGQRNPRWRRDPAAFAGRHAPPRRPCQWIVSVWVALIEVGSQCGQALVAHQHQEALLREIGGRGRVEAGGPILDGIKPVGGDRLAGRKLGPFQRLRRQPFDRIAVDGPNRSRSQMSLISRPLNEPSRKALTLTYIKQFGSSNCDKMHPHKA